MSAPAEALLLACVHQDPQRLGSADFPPRVSAGWEAFLELATHQRVRPLVHRRLREPSIARHVPDRILNALEADARRIALHNMRYLGEVASIARGLATRDVGVIVLKGAHLATTIYASVALREMNDVDVLVKREHLAQAVDVALARGYRPLKPLSIEADIEVGHHLTRLVKPQVAGIEIHWSITIPSEPHAIDPSELWERARPLTIAGATVLGLSREDLLLHLCFHTSYQHQFRFGLRPFCDVAAVVARERADLDWPALAARAETWQWTRGVYLTLRLARELVGAEVPPATLDSLRPRGFDDAIVATAREHVFTDASADVLYPGVARLAGGASISSRLRYLRTRMLPPRHELARLYGLPRGSVRVPLSYARHAAHLLRRHGVAAARLLLKRDPQMTATAARADVLRRWLDP